VGLGVDDPDSDAHSAGLVWMHALAIGYSPAYLAENADGIRRDWPRVPLPNSREALEASARLGEEVAALLDTEAEVVGVTSGRLSPLGKTVGVVSKVGGGSLDPSGGDLAVTAKWGYGGQGKATMPGKGRIVSRQYSEAERAAIEADAAQRGTTSEEVLALIGPDTCDVYLNDDAYWRNIPAHVWGYYIGGYQVIKKWLSYRERDLLGRALTADEARHVTGTARRLLAIILRHPRLDENYRNIKTDTYPWPRAGGHHAGEVT